MVIIELTYKKTRDVVEQYLQKHCDFLARYYEQGIFIASGPKVPRDGGVILAKADKNEVLKLIESDPFYVHSIADYKLVQFEPNRYTKEFKTVISSTLAD